MSAGNGVPRSGDRASTSSIAPGTPPTLVRSTGPDAEDELLGRLRAALDAAGLGPSGLDVPPPVDPLGRTLAAGLVLIYPRLDPSGGTVVPHIVLTRRTTTLRKHSGQISLPGGRHDATDGSLLRTALRETHEELGVEPEGLAVWGRLEPEWIVVTHYLLAPFIAYSPRRPAFRPAPAEVAEVIELPLATLLDPTSLAEETWELAGAPRQVHFFRHGEHKIWGATARVLSKLVDILTPDGGTGDERGAPRILPGLVLPERTRPLDV